MDECHISQSSIYNASWDYVSNWLRSRFQGGLAEWLWRVTQVSTYPTQLESILMGFAREGSNPSAFIEIDTMCMSQPTFVLAASFWVLILRYALL